MVEIKGIKCVKCVKITEFGEKDDPELFAYLKIDPRPSWLGIVSEDGYIINLCARCRCILTGHFFDKNNKEVCLSCGESLEVGMLMEQTTEQMIRMGSPIRHCMGLKNRLIKTEEGLNLMEI